MITLLILLVSVLLCSTFPLQGNDTTILGKRSYTVPRLPDGAIAAKEGEWAWPVVELDPKRGNIQLLRYCYYDEASADHLDEIVNAAIAFWAPAMEDSSLKIMLDPKADGRIHRYCSQFDSPVDALVISDEGEECASSTTIGYEYLEEEDDSGDSRHTLKFCGWDEDWDDEPEDRAQLIVEMAHELGECFKLSIPQHQLNVLGHAMGFAHEHQRPDRDDYLEVRPGNLNSFDQVCVYLLLFKIALLTHDHYVGVC